jgi:hypothetical protein
MIFIGMDNINDLLVKLLGRIKLSKPRFFGMDSDNIIVVVSPSLKIFGIKTSPERLSKSFPFRKGSLLDTKLLASWAKENGYNITFESQVPSLKRKLYQSFGDVMVEGESREKSMTIMVMEELEKSHLPESVKTWAKENPEKFIQNIETIQEMLKK